MGLENHKCDRCYKDSNILQGSYFDVDMLCIDCNSKEQNHPNYKLAKEKELQQVRLGNFNYQGIGKPNDL